MTTKEILEGLVFRLDNLKKSYQVLEKEQDMDFILNDYDSRIDELESVYAWIKGNSDGN